MDLHAYMLGKMKVERYKSCIQYWDFKLFDWDEKFFLVLSENLSALFYKPIFIKFKRDQLNSSEKYLLSEANYFLSFVFRDIYKILNIK